METIKSYTDIEQSKKLAEILPLESADMYYKAIYRLDKPKEILEYTLRPIIGSILKAIEHKNLMKSFTLETKTYKMKDIGVPCWSLAALFGVLPKIINNETLFIETSAALWHIGYRNIYTARADNPVDACYEMILKLHELNLL